MANKNKNKIFGEINSLIEKEYFGNYFEYDLRNIKKEDVYEVAKKIFKIELDKNNLAKNLNKILSSNKNLLQMLDLKIKLLKKELNFNISTFIVYQKQCVNKFATLTDNGGEIQAMLNNELFYPGSKNNIFINDIKQAVDKLQQDLVETLSVRKNMIITNKLIKVLKGKLC